MIRRYLDHNATTPLGEAARAALERWLGEARDLGNPSSQHGRGRAARQAVEAAREEVGRLVGAAADRVVFTASGSEAAALAVLGLARRVRARDPRRERAWIGASEHPCVLGAGEVLAREGYVVGRLPVDRGGRVILDEALALVDEGCALIALQLANHETGVLQPVEALAARARSVGAASFSDAVQAAGKIAVDVGALGVDALAISAHKLYAPPGAGALVLGRGADVEPLIGGGHQERGRRAGTEAVPAILAFGAAAREAAGRLEADAARLATLQARLEQGLRATGATIFGEGAVRLPNTTLCAWDGVAGQLVMIALDLAGLEVSTGAACSSGSVQPSAVLLAAGHERSVAAGAVRISLGRDNDEADVEALLAALPAIVARISAKGA